MKNKSFFWAGIALSPLILILFWAFSKKPLSPLEGEKSPPKTLISIDFIPSRSSEKGYQEEFLWVPLDESQPLVKKKLSDYQGKPLIVHFWATWCEACLEEIPQLDQYQNQFGNDFHLIIIASDQTEGAAIRDFYKTHHIKNLSIFIDGKTSLAQSMAVHALPTSVFFSSKTKELGRIIGPIDWKGDAGILLKTYLSQR